VNIETENQIWLLVSKKLAGEADQTELTELKVLLDEYPEINSIVQQMFDWWGHDRKENMEDNSYFLFQNIIKRIK
jgi:hypothetical protein